MRDGGGKAVITGKSGGSAIWYSMESEGWSEIFVLGVLGSEQNTNMRRDARKDDLYVRVETSRTGAFGVRANAKEVAKMDCGRC